LIDHGRNLAPNQPKIGGEEFKEQHIDRQGREITETTKQKHSEETSSKKNDEKETRKHAVGGMGEDLGPAKKPEVETVSFDPVDTSKKIN
jgi:hypothetical protein